MSEAAEKTFEELSTRKDVQQLKRLGEDFEKTCSGGRARLDWRARAGRVCYGLSPLPVPAGMGKVKLYISLGSKRGTKVNTGSRE